MYHVFAYLSLYLYYTYCMFYNSSKAGPLAVTCHFPHL